jgi:hypothetical protein
MRQPAILIALAWAVLAIAVVALMGMARARGSAPGLVAIAIVLLAIVEAWARRGRRSRQAPPVARRASGA